MLCKKTYKNQITLPKKIAEKFHGAEYFNAEVKEGRIILEPMIMKPLASSSLSQIKKKIASLGISPQDIDQAIQSARCR